MMFRGVQGPNKKVRNSVFSTVAPGPSKIIFKLKNNQRGNFNVFSTYLGQKM